MYYWIEQRPCTNCQVIKCAAEFVETATICMTCTATLNNLHKSEMAVKLCSSCQIVKPTTDFWKRARNVDGLCYACKLCEIKRRKQRIQNKMIDMKTCCRCRVTKPIKSFIADKHQSDGYIYYCKDCAKISRRKRRPDKIEVAIFKKTCSFCQLNKLSTEFHRSSRCHDKLNYYCKMCVHVKSLIRNKKEKLVT